MVVLLGRTGLACRTVIGASSELRRLNGWNAASPALQACAIMSCAPLPFAPQTNRRLRQPFMSFRC